MVFCHDRGGEVLSRVMKKKNGRTDGQCHLLTWHDQQNDKHQLKLSDENDKTDKNDNNEDNHDEDNDHKDTERTPWKKVIA